MTIYKVNTNGAIDVVILGVEKGYMCEYITELVDNKLHVKGFAMDLEDDYYVNIPGFSMETESFYTDNKELAAHVSRIVQYARLSMRDYIKEKINRL